MYVATSTSGSNRTLSAQCPTRVCERKDPMVRTSPVVKIAFFVFTSLFSIVSFGQSTTPPTAPYNLTATAANCGEVDLTWSPAVDNSGTGLYTYTVQRSDNGGVINSTLGASRTWFDDTSYVKSSTAVTYTVIAKDNAGNTSLPSNSVAVTTPACTVSAGEQIIGGSASVGTLDAKEPLGKIIATWGSRTAYLYLKWNSSSTLDTWIYIKDSDTGQTSNFILRKAGSYYMAENDYVFTSATDLWTVARDSGVAQQVRVSHYQLSGSTIPTSASLVSTQLFGDAHSTPRSMIRLKSGALVVAWVEADNGYLTTDLSTGFAYHNPSNDTWSTQFPVTVANPFGGNTTMSQMALAQHPADDSIWAFVKRDGFAQIIALHFTESSGGLTLDWSKANYIADPECSYTTESCYNDGDDGPEPEFPYLAAVADSSRNAILLAYQRYDYHVFSFDSTTGSFYKEATVAIAQVAPDGTKSFITFPNYIERVNQFGFAVLADGTLWLTYHPMNHQNLTWNQVYTSTYSAGNWSTPQPVGYNYNDYRSVGDAGRFPGLVTYRTDQPVVAFRTPDQNIHTFDLTNLGSAPATTDSTAPVTSITSPASGTTVSGIAGVTAGATDNVGVTRVDLLVDGAVVATSNTAPASFGWDTTGATNGSHSLQTKAYDAAGNIGASGIVTVNVNNPSALSNLSVTITSPGNGSKVPRNQKVSINALASDNVSVKGVQFLVNKKQVCSVATAPYTCTWKVPAKAGIVYNIQATATDVTGTAASQTITVTAQ